MFMILSFPMRYMYVKFILLFYKQKVHFYKQIIFFSIWKYFYSVFFYKKMYKKYSIIRFVVVFITYTCGHFVGFGYFQKT